MTDIELKYKAELRIPTDQYAYISVWVEDSPEAIIEAYRHFKGLWDGGSGLSSKDFNAALDEYLLTDNLKNGAELYAQMNLTQQMIFQEIKKSLKRIKNKQSKE